MAYFKKILGLLLIIVGLHIILNQYYSSFCYFGQSGFISTVIFRQHNTKRVNNSLEITNKTLNIFDNFNDTNNKLNLTNYITRIIHQSWKTKIIPNQFIEYSKSWTNSCFNDWKYILWTDSDNLQMITHYYPWFLKHYLTYPKEIYRADVSRYFYMYHYGGLYTDLDNECLKPFEHLLENYTIVFGAMIGHFGPFKLPEGYVQNSFMYSRPRQKFWMDLIKEIQQTKLQMLPEYTTGPIVLNKMIELYRNTHQNESVAIKVYPPNYFCPFSWINKGVTSPHCKDKGKMSKVDWLECKKSMTEKGSYVVQYHAHTW